MSYFIDNQLTTDRSIVTNINLAKYVGDPVVRKLQRPVNTTFNFYVQFGFVFSDSHSSILISLSTVRYSVTDSISEQLGDRQFGHQTCVTSGTITAVHQINSSLQVVRLDRLVQTGSIVMIMHSDSLSVNRSHLCCASHGNLAVYNCRTLRHCQGNCVVTRSTLWNTQPPTIRQLLSFAHF